jgi:calcium/calmodulin-dependent protein kinase I
MAQLRHGPPVSQRGWLLKEGANGALFRRYMRLQGTSLSNAHSDTQPPSWDVCVLQSPFVRGDRPRELVVRLPRRDLSYFAETDGEYRAWVAAMDQAKDRDIHRYYRLGKMLGEGAFAKVHAGEDVETSEQFAIKVIHKSRQDPKEVEFILREMDIMMSVSHPNIVNTYDIFDSPTVLHLVLEFMGGGELFDIVADKGHLSEQQASQVVRDIITGVEYLHSCDVVHCDIKPENILCKTKRWPLEVKLCDFGLSNFIDRATANADGDDNTMSAMIGTPGYVAPEVVKREKYGPPVDMWACGVVLYVMLSGRMPFYGRDDVDVLRRTAQGKYTFPDREWSFISEDAKSLVKALLQVDPSKRLTARAALQHRWLETPANNSAVPLENDLSGIHSSRRKFKKAVMAAVTIERMKAAVGNATGVPGASNLAP